MTKTKTDLYTAWGQQHPKCILDIGEALAMMTNLIRVQAVTEQSVQEMRLGRMRREMNQFVGGKTNLLMPLIEYLARCGQMSRALTLLDQFTDPPFNRALSKNSTPFLQPRKHELAFLFSVLKKHETNANLLEKTLNIVIKINGLHADSNAHVYLLENEASILSNKFMPKDALLQKLNSVVKTHAQGGATRNQNQRR